MTEALRQLPSTDRLAAAVGEAVPDATATEATAVARAALAERRAAILAGAGEDGPDLLADAARRLRPSLRRVLNATGVVLHTNLGRAPLPAAALEAVAATAGGYADLELDLASGRRGSRHDHVEPLLCELTGAEAAMAVNNGAAAALLAVAALAGPGRAVVVSRGQLVEIGGGFRVPEVVAQAGAELLEVGTTNRTRVADVERAIAAGGDRVALLARFHPSNFRTIGFTEEVGIEELCALGVPVLDDVGSGALGDEHDALAGEPSVRRSVRAGAAVVSCSGDKLLGGPQAGLLVGTRAAISACRRHPLARALRIDRLCLAALEATLRLHRDPARARRDVPVLAMLTADAAELQARAERIAAACGGALERATARVGGGSLPLLELPGPVVALPGEPEAVAARLRSGEPPVLARIHDGRVLLDPRTLTDDEADEVAEAARRACDR